MIRPIMILNFDRVHTFTGIFLDDIRLTSCVSNGYTIVWTTIVYTMSNDHISTICDHETITVLGVAVTVINPQHACAVRVRVVYQPHSCVSVCLSVCLSVCYHASEGITQLYSKMKTYSIKIGFSRFNFEKTFHSKVMA